MRRIDAGTLRGWITDGAELALLDAREEGEFGASHLFWAVPCPYSKRELRAPSLLPQRGTRVVVCDDGRGVAEKLGAYLEGIDMRRYSSIVRLSSTTMSRFSAIQAFSSGASTLSVPKWCSTHSPNALLGTFTPLNST